MGRRSRKRETAGSRPRPRARGPAAPLAEAPRAATYKADRADAPQPAWAPFPLTELCILLAIVLLALGFFVAGGDRRIVLLAGGIVLVTLAAGELAIREHFAGYRSHSSLLAGIVTILLAVVLRVATVPAAVIPPLAAIAFAAGLLAFRRAFARRSGGVSFRA
jgi:hypothetical protein